MCTVKTVTETYPGKANLIARQTLAPRVPGQGCPELYVGVGVIYPADTRYMQLRRVLYLSANSRLRNVEPIRNYLKDVKLWPNTKEVASPTLGFTAFFWVTNIPQTMIEELNKEGGHWKGTVSNDHVCSLGVSLRPLTSSLLPDCRLRLPTLL